MRAHMNALTRHAPSSCNCCICRGSSWHQSMLSFSFMTDFVISQMSPSSGPVRGATLVRVRGSRFAFVEDVRCRFGRPLIHPFIIEARADPGSFDQTTEEVRCLTPAAQIGLLPLEITINGQQFSRSLMSVHVYNSPRVEAVAPDSGPIAGGTVINVTGSFLGGEHHKCHFRGTDEAGTIVQATPSSESNSLRCQVPPGAAGLASLVEVTLNAQQFTNNNVRFSYYEELHVSSLSPTSGPVEGGTQLVVAGYGFVADSRLTCRFASANFETTVPAVFILHDAVQCVVPSMAGRSIRRELIGSLIPRLLVGSASLMLEHDHQLGVVLNERLDHFVAGTFFMDIYDTFSFAPKAFSLQFNLTTIAGPALVHEGAVVRGAIMDANLGRGDGWSFSYGDIAHGLVSERGAGIGLRIQVLRFTTNELRVLHGGHLLLSRNISGDQNEMETFLVRIEVQSSELSVHLGEQLVVAHLPLPGWCPRRSWRMAIGSRSGASASRHEFRGVTIAASPYEDGDALSVELAANGVDYTADEVKLFVRPTPSFGTFAPTTGSAGGSVPLTIFGSGMRGGNNYRVAFGSEGSQRAVVLASYVFVQGSDALRCLTPEHVTGLVRVTITLNGQQYHSAGHFGYYDVPHVRDMSPTSGPVLGNTRIRVWGSDFSGGSVYFCRFNSTLVEATFNVAAFHELSCRIPNGMPIGVHSLEVTLNGQEFTASLLNFTVYGSSSVNSVCPSSGPILGGSAVRILGAMLANGSHYLCRFGDVVVNASHLTGSLPHEVRCIAPLRPNAAVVPVEISLNGQNYTTSEILFTYHEPAALVELCPSTGPAHGGTVVQIFGAQLELGSHYAVAIDDGEHAAVVPATYYAPIASVLFVTPPATVGHLRISVTLNGQQFTYGCSIKLSNPSLHTLPADAFRIASSTQRIFGLYVVCIRTPAH